VFQHDGASNENWNGFCGCRECPARTLWVHVKYLDDNWIEIGQWSFNEGNDCGGAEMKHSSMKDKTMNIGAANAAQKASPTYRIPALDEDFILGDSTRGLRFLLEYQKAEEVLRAAQIISTIVVFGSARINANARGAQGRWYREAQCFGKIASERGGALNPSGERHNVIATGGGPGLMEAANRGAYETGAPSIGLNITLPHEQEPNPYTTPELTFRFHYFAMRKMHFAMRASALVVFPGGFGTFDELFEILTLRQTAKMRPIPIILSMSSYWKKAVSFEYMVEAGTIEPKDLGLFGFADDAESCWAELVRRGLSIG
jgi:uncharacterized protein (TIGR00730 family)